MDKQKGIASYLIVIIALIGIAIGIYLVQNYTSFLPKASNTGAALALSPSQITTGQGCELSFDINLDSGGDDTDGTDVILKYDPSILTISSIQNGTIYPMYPGSKADNDKGLTVISGLSSPSNPYNGSGKLATIIVKINPTTIASTTQINFDFDPSNPYKTTDSNIVEKGTIAELLRGVTNASLTINPQASCNSSPTPTISPSSTPLPSASSTPSATNISAILDNSGIRPRAIISWSGVQNPTRLDKVEVYYANLSDPNKKIFTDWVYARTCDKNFSPEITDARSFGNCRINLGKSRVTYEFRYLIYNSGTTLTINTR